VFITKNLEAWEEAKKEIDAIPEHPNRLPPALASGDAARPREGMQTAGPSGTARRDSGATINGK
jgi:hypothetical protein